MAVVETGTFPETTFPMQGDPPTPIPVVVAPFNRLMNIGTFGDADGSAPHNVPSIGPIYPDPWLDWEYMETHGFTKAQIDAEVAKVRARGQGVWHYSPPDHRSQLSAYLKAGDVIFTNAYRMAGESISGFEERITAELLGTLTYGFPVELVCGSTVFNGLTEYQALECFPVYRELADLSVRIRGLRFFSWAQNSGGAKFHPAMHPWLEAYLEASPGPYVPPQPVRESARRRRLLENA